MKKLLIVTTCIFAGILLTLGALRVFPSFALFETESESSNTQIINSITRQEQVVLLRLGIQGISEKSEKSRFFGVDIPGSDRASFVQYTFNAKLGLDGKAVEVTQTGESDYRVVIPEFIFIGHSNEDFKLITEKNGVLSGVTPKISAVEMINSILNDEAQNEYIESNVEVLNDQAKNFYTSIITSIDPSITVSFEFRQGPR